MGLGDWFAQRNGLDVLTAPQGVGQALAERSYSIADPALAVFFGGAPVGAISVSENTALTLSAVFRAVVLVSGSVGSLPLQTQQGDANGLSQTVPSFLDNVGGDRYTPVEWSELVMVHLLLHGNAYLQHIRNGAGQLVALYPVHPACVSVDWDDARPGGKVYKVSGINSDGTAWNQEFDARTMTQVMGPSLDGLVGLSVISRARVSMGTALAGENAAYRQHSSGAMTAGLVTPADNESDLTPDEAETVRDTVKRTMTGSENAGGIAVLSRALRYQSMQMSAADMQFLESRKFSIDEVCRWFGVQPHQLAETEKSTSWGQGIDKLNQGFARETLQGWTGRIEARLSRLLVAGRRARFDYTAFVRPSPREHNDLLMDQVREGVITPNEARAQLNMRPAPGGDQLRIPAGAGDPAATGSAGPESTEEAP